EELLDRQAASVGLPLWKVDLPFPCSNADYESRMAQVCARASAEGLYGIAFGDLFLEDIRAYRIEKLAGTGLQPIFPVWTPDLGITTAELARQMIAAGLRAHLTCIDPRSLSPSFAGRTFDASLLAPPPPRPFFPRPYLRRQPPRRPPRRGRPLRRARRVPYLRLRRPHVLAYRPRHSRRASGARQFHLCRSPPQAADPTRLQFTVVDRITCSAQASVSGRSPVCCCWR